MAVESATTINQLDQTKPGINDLKSEGDDHIRLLKSAIKNTLPNLTGVVTPTHVELNRLAGVTSAIQTQIDAANAARIAGDDAANAARIAGDEAANAARIAGDDAANAARIAGDADLEARKADINGETYTGTHNFTGAAVSVAMPTSADHAVTKLYADGLVFSAALPAQAGNAGKFITTDGVTARWDWAENTKLSGPTELYIGTAYAYTITDFDSFSSYAVSVSAGSVSRNGADITFTAPATAQAVTLTVTTNGVPRAIALTVLPAGVLAPTITNPAGGATGLLGPSLTLTSSAFAWAGVADTHLNSDWQLATDAGFTTIVQSTSADAANRTSWTATVATSTTYFARARHRGAANGVSAWSPTVTFTTAASFNNFIATPTATPAAFGDALEGGFYAGLVWNEVTTSATGATLATGSRVFTVAANMATTPLFYAGQTLEVRSRANPANRFQGTVTAALNTSLTLNVTSITGSGTFADWSVMSRYRVIAAPKASGENASVAIKNANTALPTACQTLTEGWRATEAMRLADTAVVYPAAHWARNLNIGSRTDWYVPARDELELLWRNLKPVTNNNYVTADRPVAASFNYANNGSFGDTANTHGLNNNSAPAGAAYTASVPGQVAATAFRTGGAEAFEFGSAFYWSSTDYNASSAWGQHWNTSNPGNQNDASKAAAGRVRAVRRSII